MTLWISVVSLISVVLLIAISAWIRSYYIRQTAPELLPGEMIKQQSWALYLYKWDMIKGRLYLTNQHLIFCASPFSLSNQQISMALTDIDAVVPGKTGLQIKTRQEEQPLRFGISSGHKWQKDILQEIKQGTV